MHCLLVKEHKADINKGYAGYQFHDDEYLLDSQTTVTGISPLHIDAGDLGHDALEIPSPTCKLHALIHLAMHEQIRLTQET